VSAVTDAWFLRTVQKYDGNIIKKVYDIPGFPSTTKYHQEVH
jgi:hypothetical protein